MLFFFNLFVVWTKTKPYPYLTNIVKVFEFPGYSDYLSTEKCLFIGDFNTPATKERRESYDKLLKLGLIDCANPEDVLKPTYSHGIKADYFTADYCFINKVFKEDKLYNIKETIFDLDDNETKKDKYKGLSDHVPLQVDISY